jgi:diguanylate cyclase (GGDEF)-like protein
MSDKALEHIQKLLKDTALPTLDGEIADILILREIHNDLAAIRKVLASFSSGDFSPDITITGAIPDYLAALQGRMHHLFSHMKDEEKAVQERESRFKYLADHDPLTGALNRRSFMEQALVEVQAAAKLGISCGIVMMDIDFFKNFNDTYGHLAGDRALRHLVEVIGLVMRKNDFLGRYGGEEFVFFFSHTNKKIGMAIAERLRKTLAESPVALDIGPVPMFASFGVAMLNEVDGFIGPETVIDPEFIERLINNADRALYQAKNTGRNKVVCFKKDDIKENFEK